MIVQLQTQWFEPIESFCLDLHSVKDSALTYLGYSAISLGLYLLARQAERMYINEIIKIVVDHDSYRVAEIPKLKKTALLCMETLGMQRWSLGETIKWHDVLTNSQLPEARRWLQKPKLVNWWVWISRHRIPNSLILESSTTNQLNFLDWIL